MKKPIETLQVAIPLELQQAFSTTQTTTTLKIYEFYAQKENGPLLLYSTVAELYAPKVVDVLKSLKTEDSPAEDRYELSAAYLAFKKWILTEGLFYFQ